MKYRKIALSVIAAAIVLTGCVKNPSEKGVEYLEDGKYKEAIEQFQDAIDSEVNAGDAYRGIGIAKWEQEDYEGAKEAFQNALDNGAKKTGTIYNFMGNCDMKLSRPESALNYFRLGIGQEDSSEELKKEMHFNMIVAYEQMKDWESAKAKLKEYLAEYPDDEAAKKELEFLETR